MNMTEELRARLIWVAVNAWDLCGSMAQSIRDCAADMGISRSDIDPHVGGIIVAAHQQIDRDKVQS